MPKTQNRLQNSSRQTIGWRHVGYVLWLGQKPHTCCEKVDVMFVASRTEAANLPTQWVNNEELIANKFSFTKQVIAGVGRSFTSCIQFTQYCWVWCRSDELKKQPAYKQSVTAIYHHCCERDRNPIQHISRMDIVFFWVNKYLLSSIDRLKYRYMHCCICF